MAKVCAAFPGPNHQHPDTPSAAAPALPPPRRPRVREVSSRFMSPIVSTSSSGDLHVPPSKHTATSASSTHHNQQRSQSAQRRESHLNESLSYADENKYDRTRSLDTPLPISMQRKHQHQQCDVMQLRASCSNKFPMRSSANFARSRSDTPGTAYKIHTSPRSTKTVVASVASTAAAKLVQSSGMSSCEIPGSKCARSLDLDSQRAESIDTTQSSSDSCEPKTFIVTDQESSVCSSPVRVQNPKVRAAQEVRSSMPESDLLPIISSKLLAHNRDTPKTSTIQGYHYLISPLPNFEQQFVPGTAMSVCRPPPNGISLPPHPPNVKLGVEARKATKVSNRQEQVHSLRMLHNHHLQWRYVNAKAQVAMNAQSIAAERSFHAIAAKISELHNSVNQKQAELRELKKERTLSTVLEAQVPYLNEWATLEGEYTSSLGGAIKALRDTSLRLPITGNVKADTEEVARALNSASSVMEVMIPLVESFLPKGGEMVGLSAELAAVVNSERGLLEECSDLSSRTHMLQVMECSLRAQLVQLKLYNSLQAEVK